MEKLRKAVRLQQEVAARAAAVERGDDPDVLATRRTTFKVVQLVRHLLKAQVDSEQESKAQDPADHASSFSGSDDESLSPVSAAAAAVDREMRNEASGGGGAGSHGAGLGPAISAKEAQARLRRALQNPVGDRKASDVDEIYAVVRDMKNEFVQKQSDEVQRSICSRLRLEEFSAREQIFEYGDVGDRLYLVLQGRVLIEVPRSATEMRHGSMDPQQFETSSHLDKGKVFGELAQMSHDKRRNGRATSLCKTQLLSLTEEDYSQCVGAAHENFVLERVAFLRSMDRAVLGDSEDRDEGISEVDLRAMASHLHEQNYTGETLILAQNGEADRVIFVRSGFCKVTRRLDCSDVPSGEVPEFWGRFDRYAEKGGPPPNPFAADAVDIARREATEKTGDAEISFKGPAELRKLLRQYNVDEDFGRKREGGAKSSSPRRGGRGEAEERGGGAAPASARGRLLTRPTGVEKAESSGERSETVIVDVLHAGRSFGVMEMLEGLTYQCSVVADPWAEVYVISKYDLIRNTSKSILHKLFCDYKTRLSGERLMQRLKQKSRWNNYKRELLDEIRNRKSRPVACIDRREPSRRTGAGDLSKDDYERVGDGQSLWDKRAQTPPKPAYGKKGRQHTFRIAVRRDDRGWPVDVDVEREVHEASQAVLEEKILKTTVSARVRDRSRRARLKEKCLRTLDSLNEQKEGSARELGRELSTDSNLVATSVRPLAKPAAQLTRPTMSAPDRRPMPLTALSEKAPKKPTQGASGAPAARTLPSAGRQTLQLPQPPRSVPLAVQQARKSRLIKSPRGAPRDGHEGTMPSAVIA